jgi:hypothetical protein
MGVELPEWAARLIDVYESETANQFVLYGNVNDRFVLPSDGSSKLGSLYDFLRGTMMPRFEVLLSYDLGNGIRVDRGGEILTQWPGFKEVAELPRAPRPAIEFLTRYFRYTANRASLGQQAPRVGFIMKAAQLVAPALPGALNYDLNALALLIRDWATDDLLSRHQLVTWLVADNLNDLHPMIVNSGRTVAMQIPLPSADDLRKALGLIAPECPTALAADAAQLDTLAPQLTGATLTSVESLLKVRNHDGRRLDSSDLVGLKKELVEKDSGDLVEFIESSRTLDDVYAQDTLRSWLRQDIQLWRANDLAAMPMGYLVCGPVGTGKTYLVECLAGEAGIPVVKLKNFRDRWVGSTEGNLERIFRLLEGLGRCFVFIDEADQALGRRDSGANDAGLSGRIYGMFAEQMSKTSNRGKLLWVLASSRPDLIEVDLKRPGRVDVKIPIFPTTAPRESFALIRALAGRRGVSLTEDDFNAVQEKVPILLTAGAAEVLAVKVYRTVKIERVPARDALDRALTGYQPPIPDEVMHAQIALAAKEATDGDFVPEMFRAYR